MEEMVKHPASEAQDELVRDYCTEAERHIMLAGSRDDAVDIKEKWCRRFRQECKSMLIVNASAAYLDQIITRQWKHHVNDPASNTDEDFGGSIS